MFNGRLSRTSRHRPRPSTRGRKSPHGTWHAARRGPYTYPHIFGTPGIGNEYGAHSFARRKIARELGVGTGTVRRVRQEMKSGRVSRRRTNEAKAPSTRCPLYPQTSCWSCLDADGTGGFQIDPQFDLRRLIDREIAGVRAVQNPLDEIARPCRATPHRPTALNGCRQFGLRWSASQLIRPPDVRVASARARQTAMP